MIACNLRRRAAFLRRLRNDPQLLVAAPAPPPLNRRDYLDRPHRAMPIVAIDIALRPGSPETQGSRQRTLTLPVLLEQDHRQHGSGHAKPPFDQPATATAKDKQMANSSSILESHFRPGRAHRFALTHHRTPIKQRIPYWYDGMPYGLYDLWAGYQALAPDCSISVLRENGSTP
jgi:hypothetical protein